MESVKPVQSTSSILNNSVEAFDWDKFDNSQEGKEMANKTKLEGLQDEIKYYNSLIQKKKRDISRLERQIKIAERKLKAEKEAQRAERIKALLKANKGKRVVIEWCANCPDDESFNAELAENIVVENEGGWVISGPEWAGLLQAVKRIYVEAEI